MDKLINIMRNEPDKAFDYIADEYSNFSKAELASVAKELLYAIHTNAPTIEEEILSDTAEELADTYSYLYDEDDYEDEQGQGR